MDAAKKINPKFRDRVSACIVFPTDPVGLVPGGIDTFIRGLLRWAPDDIDMSLIGMTTDGTAGRSDGGTCATQGGTPSGSIPC